MPIYERGPVRIHYEEMGSGFPLLVIPGGGLNSTIAGLDTSHPFNAMKEFDKDGFRCRRSFRARVRRRGCRAGGEARQRTSPSESNAAAFSSNSTKDARHYLRGCRKRCRSH